MNNDIESNIRKNLIELRRSNNLKQTELAIQVGYSDKTISRWENGSSIPDIVSLSTIATFYNITIDDLIKENAVKKSSTQALQESKNRLVNNILLTSLSVFTVWLVAIILYVGFQIIKQVSFWQIFIWAVPASSIIANKQCKSYNELPIVETILLSITSWGLVTSAFCQLIHYNLWQLFFIPIPIEFIIIIYTLMLKPNKRKLNKK